MVMEVVICGEYPGLNCWSMFFRRNIVIWSGQAKIEYQMVELL